jgi:hypothetical protein
MLHEMRPGEMGSMIVSTPVLARFSVFSSAFSVSVIPFSLALLRIKTIAMGS